MVADIWQKKSEKAQKKEETNFVFRRQHRFSGKNISLFRYADALLEMDTTLVITTYIFL